jgi:L-ascorbate metabolism protein UlaG (beta-lactamase superfamily)
MKTPIVMLLAVSLTFTACKEGAKKETANTPATASQAESEMPEEPVIRPIEHATAVLQWGDVTIYIDPVGGAAAFEGQADPGLILITDIHGDHLNVETLEELRTENARIIAPKAVADQLPEALRARTEILDNGAKTEQNGILVEAIPMYNLREEAKDFHVKGRGNGYVLEKDGTRVYFSGDTEDIPEMRALENIDKAFICMNLPYTMTVERAADAVVEFAPAQVYPYHFRGRPDVSDVAKFKQLVNEGNPDVEVVQLDWYPGEDY